jgi:hypothetical protein
MNLTPLALFTVVVVAAGCTTSAPDDLKGLIPMAHQEQRTVEPTELIDGRRGAIETVQRRTLYAAP